VYPLHSGKPPMQALSPQRQLLVVVVGQNSSLGGQRVYEHDGVQGHTLPAAASGQANDEWEADIGEAKDHIDGRKLTSLLSLAHTYMSLIVHAYMLSPLLPA